MQICSACGAPNALDAVLCGACHQPLAAPVAVPGSPGAAPLPTPSAQSMNGTPAMPLVVPGPLPGAAAYPGAPEANQYGAKDYRLSNQIEAQRTKPTLRPGDTIGHDRYQIKRVVALGGMGAVYKAEDQNLHRPCAVKEMLDTFTDPKDRQQVLEWFKREAALLHDLNHPAIPRVRDSFEQDGRYYLVMDFVEGRNLAEVMEQEGMQPEERVRRWGMQLCDVLSYLHHQGIIFRDLKPANVMVGKDDRVKLIDFGIARSLRAQTDAMVIVTYGFAAPEQLQNQAEPRSDVFSLGATLHRLLTNHDANNNKPMIFNFPDVRLLRPDVTPAFAGIIAKALAPRPMDRWTTAGEMGRAIRALPPLSPTAFIAVPPAMPFTAAPPQRNDISRPPPPFDESIAQARAFLDQERWPEAQRAARKAVEVDRNNPVGHKMMGIVYARSRPPDAQHALQAYQESLQINPNDAETHRLIGDVYLFLLQKPNEAIQAYQKALQLNPNDYETHRFLGMCFEQTQHLEQARGEYAMAVRLAPHYVPAHMSYGQLMLRLGQWMEAERAFVEALRLNPALPVARHLLAQVYEQQGRIAEALREAEYAVQVDPRDTAAVATLTRLRRNSRPKRMTRPLT